MGMQARMSSSDGRLYNPSRDVAHHFVDVAKMVIAKIEQPGQWPSLARHIDECDLTDEELGIACKAFVDYVASVVDHPNEKMHDALHRCGWNSVSEDAMFAVMAVLGSISMGIYWTGAREATLNDEGPGITARELTADAKEIADIMTAPRWRRRWRKRWLRFKNAWNAATKK